MFTAVQTQLQNDSSAAVEGLSEKGAAPVV